MTEVASTSSSGFPSDSDDWSFKPSDESLALDFLRPMASGPAVPDGTCIIADDPYRVEPWKLLAAYQRDVAEGAYFFTKKAVLSSKGLRRKRTVGDADKIVGTWRVQHSKNDSNADKTVRWCKTLLSYYNADDNSKTTGYVMHEYELYKDGGEGCKGETHERVICHIKLSDREISRRKRKRKESATAAASAAAASSSSTCPSISSPASDSLFGSGWTNSPYPASWLAPLSVAFPQPAPYEASLVAAGNAYALSSVASPEFVDEEALPSGILYASTNLSPWSSATTCSSMLQHGNNPAEYYPYPYSCTEPPPLSHALPQPPVAAAVPFKTAQQQQPSAPSDAAAEGTAEPPPDCNGVWEKDIHIEKENAEQQQPQQPRSNSNAYAATTAAATHGDDFFDDYISFIEFDDINNLYDDDELEKLVGEITAEPFEVPDDCDPPYFL